VLPHCTGVGKALLSTLPDDKVRTILKQTGMPAQTAKTLTTPEALLAALAEARRVGYSLDDGEQELGVRCVAVPVEKAPVSVAISVSGPDSRVPASRVGDIAPILQRIAGQLVTDLDTSA